MVDKSAILTFDARPSARSVDENGFMHVGASHITKAAVNPYYGREIPGWKEAGLAPEEIYYGFRAPEELKKSLSTWAGLPLHIEHHIDSADEPAKLTRVGAVGVAGWNAPYVDAPLTVWDGAAIDAIEDGSFRKLSCAYRYEPDFTPGRVDGIEYDFIMRHIRGNHVALVGEGRAGADVVVADSSLGSDAAFEVGNVRIDHDSLSEAHPKAPGLPAGKPEHSNPVISDNGKRSTLMSKFKNWFRGAQDDNPEIEKKEVDLAQAIIDLHKVDPMTGEIVDITEDEDKAEEIRKIVGELAAKLEPEEAKRLTDALTDLAYSKATGEAEPEGMDNGLKQAMDKCGLDAEDPADARAFAEGVKYGESLEKDPAERERLNREHEFEGMKKAMDSCGLDAENPTETRAFAEGVKYGDRKEKEEPRKLDREHESEGMKRAMGRDADAAEMADKVLSSVPDLTPEQKAALYKALQECGAADPDEDPKAAQDRAIRGKRRALYGMDAARIKASAVAEAQAIMRNLHQAARDVRPLVGEVDPLAFDSASDVYGYALDQSGINARSYDRKAWRGMVDVLKTQKAALPSGGMARDAAPAKLDGKFSGLNNISLGD